MRLMKTTAIILGMLQLLEIHGIASQDDDAVTAVTSYIMSFDDLPKGTECWNPNSLKIYMGDQDLHDWECDAKTLQQETGAWLDKHFGRNFYKQGCWTNRVNQKDYTFGIDCSNEGKIFVYIYENTTECFHDKQTPQSPMVWNVNHGKADCEDFTMRENGEFFYLAVSLSQDYIDRTGQSANRQYCSKKVGPPTPCTGDKTCLFEATQSEDQKSTSSEGWSITASASAKTTGPGTTKGSGTVSGGYENKNQLVTTKTLKSGGQIPILPGKTLCIVKVGERSSDQGEWRMTFETVIVGNNRPCEEGMLNKYKGVEVCPASTASTFGLSYIMLLAVSLVYTCLA